MYIIWEGTDDAKNFKYFKTRVKNQEEAVPCLPCWHCQLKSFTLRDVAVFLKVQFASSLYRMINWIYFANFLSCECYRTPKHKSTLVQVLVWPRQVTSHQLGQVELDLCHHMATLGHEGIVMSYSIIAWWFVRYLHYKLYVFTVTSYVRHGVSDQRHLERLFSHMDSNAGNVSIWWRHHVLICHGNMWKSRSLSYWIYACRLTTGVNYWLGDLWGEGMPQVGHPFSVCNLSDYALLS